MDEMTSIERISNILKRKPVDRIGVFESFWGDTHAAWVKAGKIKEDENLHDHFNFDIDMCWPFNYVADLDFEEKIVEENEDTVLKRNGNGALLRWHKKHASTPEHVDFLVKDRKIWEESYKPKLKPVEKRIGFESYRAVKEKAVKNKIFFVWGGVNVFEQIHPIIGHEGMLMAMALDPDWIRDLVETYAQLNIDLMEVLFAKEGMPDGIWFFEDMGFKGRPFMSPAMYKELIQPGHIKTIDYAKSKGLPVIMHSCGYIEPLLPGMVEAGIDCLQVIEVKAGMDLLKIYKEYGDVLSLMGGIDVREIYPNDRKRIDIELEKKIPIVKEKFGYVLHSDHSIPNTVEYDTYKYFVEKGLELGTY